MTGLTLDLRQTLRSLRKHATLVSIALLTIALGVGVNTAMFSVVNAVILRPLPYPKPEQLVSLWPEKRWSLGMLDDVRERVSSYAAISAWRDGSYMLLGDAEPEPVRIAIISAAHFEVLGVSPTMGRAFTAADEQGTGEPSVVLSHGFWQRRFGGDKSVVGRSIRLAGGGAQNRTVVGILPEGFTSRPPNVDAWVPMTTTPNQAGFFGGYGMNVIGRLKPNATAELARAELRRLVPELTPEHPTQFRPIRYSPVDVVPLLEQMTRGIRTQLLILLGAVTFILLIACTNVASLLLARAHGRQREVAIQMALGCSPTRIARQVFSESVVLAVAGGTIGVVTAVLALPLIRNAVTNYVPRAEAIVVDPLVMLFAAGATLLTAVVFGAAPALHASRGSPGDVMRATAGRGQSQGRGARRVNDLFVVAEIALSLTLLAGAGLLIKSLWQLSRVDTGLDTANTLTMQLALPPGRYDSTDARVALLRQIEERISATPGVETVGAIDFLPLSGSGSGFPYRIAGQDVPAGTSQVVNTRIVTPGFFRAFRVPLKRGRMLGAQDVRVDTSVFGALVVNEAFARQHWPNADPLGGQVLGATGGRIGQVVGVVADMRQNGMDAAPAPEIYAITTQWGWSGGSLVVRGVRDTPNPDAIRAAIRSIEPNMGLRNVRPMTEVVSEAMSDRRFYARLLTWFAGLALILGLVGVYGVMTYAASRRTREFGVRLAFGATGRDLAVDVLARAMMPVFVGILLGLGGAISLTRVLTSLLYEVRATDPWVLGGVSVMLALAAAGAALVPAARASRVTVVSALQAE